MIINANKMNKKITMKKINLFSKNKMKYLRIQIMRIHKKFYMNRTTI